MTITIKYGIHYYVTIKKTVVNKEGGNMAFELFTKKGGRTSSPRVTIAKAGYIGLNSACMDKYFRGKGFVQLYWDKEKQIIGIKHVDKEIEGAFTLTSGGERRPGSIAGRSFLKYYEIDFSKSRSFYPDWNEKEDMLLIKIK